MKIVTWNVNGLRAAHKKGFLESFQKIDADIFCIQELRCETNELPEELKTIPGYFSFFNPSSIKKGHSGTAIYSRVEPKKIDYKIGLKNFDEEGRVIILEYPQFVLFNLYMPQGGRDKRNHPHKFAAYNYLISRLCDNSSEADKKMILVGDFNIAHEEIDLARPKDNKKNTGFTPEEREMIAKLISGGFIDSFREFNKEGGNYTWWSNFSHARERNIGWRVDYVFVSNNLKKNLKNAFILPKITGSDHCPSGIEIEL